MNQFQMNSLKREAQRKASKIYNETKGVQPQISLIVADEDDLGKISVLMLDENPSIIEIDFFERELRRELCRLTYGRRS